MICDICKSDATNSSGYFKYLKTSDNTATIIGYAGDEANIIIPEKIDGLTVDFIGPEAFRENKTLESVYVPSTVKIIGYQAFEECRNLNSIVFQADSQLEAVGDGAFYFCTSLESFPLCSSLTHIGDSAFGYCASLKEINLPTSLKCIDDYAFAACASLNNIVIPSNVSEMGRGIFTMCTSLKSADVQASVNRLPEETFFACTSLHNVILSESINTLGYLSFYCCLELDNIPINNLMCIEENTFILCNSNSSIVITNPDITLGAMSFGFITDTTYNSIMKRLYDLEIEAALLDDQENAEEALLRIEAEMSEIELQLENASLAEYTIYGYSGSTAETYVAENNEYGNLKFIDLEAECSHSGGEATCESKAICELCGEEYGELGEHKPTTIRQDPPSCMVNGYIITSCENCLETLGFETITAPRHTNGEAVIENEVEATCDNEGSYDSVVYCTKCSTEVSREKVTLSTTDHIWDSGVITTVATCKVNEVITYTCKYNNKHTRQELGSLNKNNHAGDTYLANQKSATCTQSGYTGDVYCADCDKFISSGSTTPVTQHSFGDWVTSKAATLLEEGTKIRTCTNCPQKETESIPRIKGEETKDENSGITVEYTDDSYNGQNIEVQVEEEFTGSQYIGQSKYGRTESWNIKTFVDGEEVQPGTPVLVKIPLPEGFDANKIVIYHVNSMNGTLEKITPVYVEDGYIKFLATSFSVYIVVDESSIHTHKHNPTVTAPTCTTQGFTNYTCACGDSYVSDYVNAPGHKDNNGDYKCDNGCGYEFEKPAPEEPVESDCSCNCHKSGFMGFIWKIINFFQKLFKINQTCSCGVKHW